MKSQHASPLTTKVPFVRFYRLDWTLLDYKAQTKNSLTLVDFSLIRKTATEHPMLNLIIKIRVSSDIRASKRNVNSYVMGATFSITFTPWAFLPECPPLFLDSIDQLFSN